MAVPASHIAHKMRSGVRTSLWRSNGTGYPVSKSLDSFNCRSTLSVNGIDYVYYSLPKAEANGLAGVS
jgi:aconitate hydratase